MVTMAMATKTGGSANDRSSNLSNGRLCCCHRRGCFCCWVLSSTVCHRDPMDLNSYSPQPFVISIEITCTMSGSTVVRNDPSSFSVISPGYVLHLFLCGVVDTAERADPLARSRLCSFHPTPCHKQEYTNQPIDNNRPFHNSTGQDRIDRPYLSMSLMKTTIKTAVGMDSNPDRV